MTFSLLGEAAFPDPAQAGESARCTACGAVLAAAAGGRDCCSPLWFVLVPS